MKTLLYKEVSKSSTTSKEEHLVENIKNGFKFLNDLLTQAEKENIKVYFNMQVVLDDNQNTKLKLNNINKNLM